MAHLALGLAGALRRHTMAASAAVVLGLAWWWQLAALQQPRELIWLGVTAFSVLTGFVALGWLRPARVGITAPQAMMLLGTVGMLGGLAFDVQRAGLEAIASMCASSGPDFLAVARLHLEWLPAMHAGMVAGGLGALAWLRRVRPGCKRQFCARFAQNIACSAWMMIGMVAGVILYYRLAAWFGSAGVPAMLGGMIGGMVWGMVVSVTLYRVALGLADARR
ncbi:MAG TPA: hypothetical protein VIH23_04090 [Burkholderiales bacterium]